ncbi:MAG: hypothetical protein IPM06_06785 [Rhizobiales bacterium]|nr:hypothetical protein [Hyphomicrobiales bacterium]
MNDAAIAKLSAITKRWLPSGEMRGHHWVAPNPRTTASQLKVDLLTGGWRDWTTGDSGDDVISLLSFLEGVADDIAVREVARMLGVELA